MQQQHRKAEEKYALIRDQARSITQDLLPYGEKSAISLEAIDHRALSQFKIWQDSTERLVHWPWDTGYREYAKQHPKRFEMATWYHNTLCSLSIGRPTYSGSRMRLDFVERRPGINPLKGKIAAINLTAIEVYARLIDAQEVRIMHPDENLLDYYASFGYSSGLLKLRGTSSHYICKKLV